MTIAGGPPAGSRRSALLLLAAVVVALAVVVVITVVDRSGADGSGPVAPQQRTLGPDTSLAGPTLFGVTLSTASGQSSKQVLDAAEQSYGTPQALRIYDAGLPRPWASLPTAITSIPDVVSFKADPALVVEGRYDTALSTWFGSAPRDHPTYWAYFHEPEDQVDAGHFTAEQFREAWQHIATLAAGADNPELRSSVILMCWTVNPASGRDWRDYVTPGTVDVLAWDCYNHGAKNGYYQSPATMVAAAVAASHEASAQWGIAELGSLLVAGDDGAARSAWLLRVAEYARQNGAAFLTYFDSTVGGDYSLDDAPSRDAFRSLLANSPSPYVR
jgi:hypothetical protein